MTVNLTYQAFSPADDIDERHPRRLIDEGELEVPGDADVPAVHGALKNAVERKAAVDDGAQVRVIATRAGDDEPHYSYVWDHGD